MPDKLSVLIDPTAFEPKILPLLSLEEMNEWNNKFDGSRRGDYRRGKILREMFDNLQVRRVQTRPDPYLMGILVLVGSKLTRGPTQMMMAYTDEAEKLWAEYNTPETRWWADRVLEGLLNMPRSYAMSAATRYFRGIGKQAKLNKPGVGLLSTENGWKEREVKTLMDVLVTSMEYSTGAYGAPLLKSESTSMYSDAAREYTEEEWEALYDAGAAFSATRVERDDDFIKELRAKLAELGMTQPPLKTNLKKPPKPRKVKVFKEGDVVRARYVRDLLPGTKLKRGDGQRFWYMDSGKTYTWYGKNKHNTFVLEDTSVLKDYYGRYRPVSTREMDGSVVVSLPKAVDPETLEAVE